MQRLTVLFTVAACLVAAPARSSELPPSPAAVSSCVVPGCDATAFIIAAIDGAQAEIRGQAYGFTSAPIAAALVRARERGIDVEMLLDKTSPCGRKEVVDTLVAAGIPVAIDHAPRIAHNKVLVIDRNRVIEGSFNFTAGAMHNAENTNLVSGPGIAGYYRAYWDGRRAASEPYGERALWCRRARAD
jgi:phosphatidylserine/phosphatidylglycerophosphate/cardiolipin synthase-like enzyme